MKIPQAFIDDLATFVTDLRKYFAGRKTPSMPPNPSPSSPETPNPDTLLPWGYASDNRHNIRVLCDLAGLSLTPTIPVTIHGHTKLFTPKDIITACVQVESNFYNYYPNGKPVTHLNKREDGTVSSTDWGICQINDRYHIGPNLDFPSVDYVLANPEKAVDYMIAMFKAGKLGLWVSYSSGAYIKNLPVG